MNGNEVARLMLKAIFTIRQDKAILRLRARFMPVRGLGRLFPGYRILTTKIRIMLRTGVKGHGKLRNFGWGSCHGLRGLTVYQSR